MAGPDSRFAVSIPRLIAVPAVITLAVTLLRLAGEYFWIGLLPQFTVWIAFTLIVGGLFGAIATFFARERASSV